MRTSTGSISVAKMIQKATTRSGKRKYVMAKPDRIETAILPNVIASATTKLLSSIGPIGGRP